MSMKRKKKILSAIAALCILLSSASVMSSCNKNDDGDDVKTDSDTEYVTGDGTSTETPDSTADESTSEDETTGDDTTGDDTIGGDTTGGDPTYADMAVAGDIIITKAYGNDSAADAPIRYSFIELYNLTDKELSLGSMSMYYGEGKSFTKLNFSNNVTIAPKGYYLIKCAGAEEYTGSEILKVEKYDLEWNIKIDNKSFELVLALDGTDISPNADLRNIDGVSSYLCASLTPSVDIFSVDDLSKNKVIVRNGASADVGYSLVNVKKSGAYDLEKITPNSSQGDNSYVNSNYVEVKFSREGGVYNEIFDLTLTAPEGYKIYYTMTGADPVSNISSVYTAPLKIANTNNVRVGSAVLHANKLFGSSFKTSGLRPGGVVVKAMAVSPDGVESAVFTQTYFVSEKLSKANTIIFSISLHENDLLGNETGAYYTYQYDLWGTRPRSRAFIEVFDKDGIKRGGSYMEFAVSGNGSSGLPMKSLRIYYKDPLSLNDPAPDSLEYDLFDDWSKNVLGQNISTFERILIRNAGNDYGHTFIRDAFVQRMAYGLNVDSMAYTPAIVFMNGELWGVYNLRERYSPEYFNQKYGVLEENIVIIENESPLKYGSSAESWNNDYVAATGDVKYATEFNQLVSYIKTHDMRDPDVYKYVTDRIDVDSFIDYMIMETYFCNNDWPGNNIKVWRNIDENDPSGMDTKWRFVLLDMDHCCGYINVNNATSNFFDKINDGTRCGAVMNGLMKNTEFKTKFALRAYELANDVFCADNAIDVLNDMAAERRELLYLQYAVYSGAGSYDTFDAQVDVMRNFINGRADNYKNQVRALTGMAEPEDEDCTVNIKLDDRYDIYIDSVLITDKKKKIKYEKGSSIKVSVKAKSGYDVFAVAFSANSGGVYKKDGSEAVFDINASGDVIVYVRAKSSGENVVSVDHGVSAGKSSSYYIDASGDLYAWGQNTNGILGIPGGNDKFSPTYVMSGVAKVESTRGLVIAETANVSSTAILTTDGVLYTVGNNQYGQLGRGGSAADLLPVDFDKRIIDVSVGQDYLLILDEDHDLWGVGNNARGQIGSKNAGTSVSKFQLVASGVKKVAAGRRTTLYIKENGDLYAIGDNRWNKVSQDDVENILTPLKIGSGMRDVAAGSHQFVVISEDNTLYYIGWRRFDVFQSTYSQSDLPNGLLYRVLGNVKSADIHEEHIVALTFDGDVYGYGINNNGELIISGNIVNSVARKIYSGAVDVAAGNGFTLIYTKDGKIVCYGKNDFGQAGKGTVSSTSSGAYITMP